MYNERFARAITKEFPSKISYWMGRVLNVLERRFRDFTREVDRINDKLAEKEPLPEGNGERIRRRPDGQVVFGKNEALAIIAGLVATAADGLELTGATLADVLGAVQGFVADGLAMAETLARVTTMLATAQDGFDISDVAVHFVAQGLVEVSFSLAKAKITFSIRQKPQIDV